MNYSEDVLDVGTYESPEMVCDDCGAQFSQWVEAEAEGEYGLTADEACPSCGSTRVKAL